MFPSLSRLTKLDLSNNNIGFIDPSGWQNITNLQHLNLSGNRLPVSELKNIKNLPNLKVLDLSYNKITSLYQNKRFFVYQNKIFFELKDLQELRLNNNSISNLRGKPFDSLEKLLILDLSRNQINSDQLDSVLSGKLSNLRELDLANNKITKLNQHQFQNLIHLERLILDENDLREIDSEPFNGLNLQLLSLSNTNLKYMSTNAFNNLSCKTLAFSNNSKLKFAELREAIKPLRDLQTLDLSACNISDEDLLDKPFDDIGHSLKHLNMSYNNLTQIPIISGLVQIEKLDFSYNRISSLLVDNDSLAVDNFLKHLSLGRTRLYLQGNRFNCNFDAGFEMIQEFEKRNFDCKTKSENYCLRCYQPVDLKNQKIGELFANLSYPKSNRTTTTKPIVDDLHFDLVSLSKMNVTNETPFFYLIFFSFMLAITLAFVMCLKCLKCLFCVFC